MNRPSIEMKGSDGHMYHYDLFRNQKHIVHIVTKPTTSHLHQAVKRVKRINLDFSGKGYAFYVVCNMPERRFFEFITELKDKPLWLLDKDFRFTKRYLSETLDQTKTWDHHDLTLIVGEDGSLLQKISYHQPSPHFEKNLNDR